MERFEPRARGVPRHATDRQLDDAKAVRDATDFAQELDLIESRVRRVLDAGRADFIDGSPSYDAASMAIIRLGALVDARRFERFLAALTEAERRAINATSVVTAHAHVALMADEEFWHTVTRDVPDVVSRLRARGA
jgi:hypothetical protein